MCVCRQHLVTERSSIPQWKTVIGTVFSTYAWNLSLSLYPRDAWQRSEEVDRQNASDESHAAPLGPRVQYSTCMFEGNSYLAVRRATMGVRHLVTRTGTMLVGEARPSNGPRQATSTAFGGDICQRPKVCQRVMAVSIGCGSTSWYLCITLCDLDRGNDRETFVMRFGSRIKIRYVAGLSREVSN